MADWSEEKYVPSTSRNIFRKVHCRVACEGYVGFCVSFFLWRVAVTKEYQSASSGSLPKNLRDEFAMAALSGIVSANFHTVESNPERVVELAYYLADAAMHLRSCGIPNKFEGQISRQREVERAREEAEGDLDQGRRFYLPNFIKD